MEFNYYNEHMPEPLGESYELLTPEEWQENLEQFYEIYPETHDPYKEDESDLEEWRKPAGLDNLLDCGE